MNGKVCYVEIYHLHEVYMKVERDMGLNSGRRQRAPAGMYFLRLKQNCGRKKRFSFPKKIK